MNGAYMRISVDARAVITPSHGASYELTICRESSLSGASEWRQGRATGRLYPARDAAHADDRESTEAHLVTPTDPSGPQVRSSTVERVPEATVRDAVVDVLRDRGLTTLFSNPGSTEVPFLAGLPDDLEFVLALHEASVVGIATGWAIARGEPALALLHTTAGLGNAVGALATARVNRAPLVVLVGQQDRRHLAHEPFLAGRLGSLAGEYPVWVDQPVRPQDLPGSIRRAYHEAVTAKGPAIVIAPMDDWAAPAGEPANQAAPGSVVRAAAADPEAVDELVDLLASAERPAIVAGSGAADAASWEALVLIADNLRGPCLAGVVRSACGIPARSPAVRRASPRGSGASACDAGAVRRRARGRRARVPAVRVCAGAPVSGRHACRGRDRRRGRGAQERRRGCSARPGRRRVRPAGPEGAASRRLRRKHRPTRAPRRSRAAQPASGGTRLRRARCAPVQRRGGHRGVAVEPSGAPGCGFPLGPRSGSSAPRWEASASGFPAAIGIRMAIPERQVVVLVGDGASLYSIQALWTAVRYRVGALIVVLANGGYAIMDRLMELEGGSSPWPGFPEIDFAALARAFGCPAEEVATAGRARALPRRGRPRARRSRRAAGPRRLGGARRDVRSVSDGALRRSRGRWGHGLKKRRGFTTIISSICSSVTPSWRSAGRIFVEM